MFFWSPELNLVSAAAFAVLSIYKCVQINRQHQKTALITKSQRISSDVWTEIPQAYASHKSDGKSMEEEGEIPLEQRIRQTYEKQYHQRQLLSIDLFKKQQIPGSIKDEVKQVNLSFESCQASKKRNKVFFGQNFSRLFIPKKEGSGIQQKNKQIQEIQSKQVPQKSCQQKSDWPIQKLQIVTNSNQFAIYAKKTNKNENSRNRATRNKLIHKNRNKRRIETGNCPKSQDDQRNEEVKNTLPKIQVNHSGSSSDSESSSNVRSRSRQKGYQAKKYNKKCSKKVRKHSLKNECGCISQKFMKLLFDQLYRKSQGCLVHKKPYCNH